MEVVNKKGKIEKLKDNVLSEVAGGLEVARPLNIAVLTDDKIEKEEKFKNDRSNDILH